jgi:hypothetical protein
MLKLIIITYFISSALLGADGSKDVDLGNLFNQLDKVISSNKNNSNINKSKLEHSKNKTSAREKNYKEFNEAAKKYHIFRSKKILKTVRSLIKEYKLKATSTVTVRRYSYLGNKKFALVSGTELNKVIKQLEVDGKILSNLNRYKFLLIDIKEYDIKTIAKVLIIVEQEIMNIMGMGVKKVSRTIDKKVQDIPMLLRTNQIFNNNIKVIDIDQFNVTLKSFI